jgi:hypothetical protein
MRWKLIPATAFTLVLSLNGFPASVNFDQEIPVEVSLSCSGCSDSYLRVVFFPTGTNYFGFTKNNNGNWISTTADKTQYFKISADETKTGTWSGTLNARLDPEDSAYSGSGSYFLKVVRYTAGGSKSGETETVSISVTGPSPTLTPVPTPLPTPTPTPKKAVFTPTATIYSTKPPERVLEIISTPIPTIFTPSFTPLPTVSIIPPQVLSSSDSADFSDSGGSWAGKSMVVTGLGIILCSFLYLIKSGKISFP